jgi:hypothetical protein
MTISMNGNDVSEAIQIAMGVGGLITLLIVGLLIYLVVRPPRRRRIEVEPAPDAIDAEEMLALIDRMERRLDVLERAVGAEDRQEKTLLEAGEGPETRRVK